MRIPKRSLLKSLFVVFLALSLMMGIIIAVQKNSSQEQDIEKLLSNLHLQNHMLLKGDGTLKRIISGILLGSPLNSKLLDCFDGKGRECKLFERTDENFQDPLMLGASRFTLKGLPCSSKQECVVERKSTYRVTCKTDKSCEQIQLRASVWEIKRPENRRELASQNFDAKKAMAVSRIDRKNSKNKKTLLDMFSRARRETLPRAPSQRAAGASIPPQILNKLKKTSAKESNLKK